MAESARASAPLSSSPEASEAASVESLALQACDDIDGLVSMHQAYACLEKLIVPQGTQDTNEVYPDRSELGALMRAVNEDLRRRIDAADMTVQSLRAALDSRTPHANSPLGG